MATLIELVPDIDVAVSWNRATEPWAARLSAQRDRDLAALSGDEWYDLRLDLASLLVYDGRPFSAQMPVLDRLGAATLDLRDVSTRLRNLLLRKDLIRWDRFASLRPSDVADWRGAGATTVTDALELVLDGAFVALTTHDLDVPEADASSLPLWVQPKLEGAPAGAWGPTVGAAASVQPMTPTLGQECMRDLGLVAAWSLRVLGATRVSDVINPKLPLQALQQVPEDVAAAWGRIAEAELSAVADPALVSVPVQELIEELVASLNDGQQQVVRRRFAAILDVPTLDVVGQEMNLTRERVRQIQAKARAKLEAALDEPKFAPLRWTAQRLRSRLGSTVSQQDPALAEALQVAFGEPSGLHEVRSALLLFLAGPYVARGTWLTAGEAPVPSGDLLDRFASEEGVVDLDGLREHLTSLSMPPGSVSIWLEEVGQTKEFAGRTILWRGSVLDKMLAVLGARGEPADVETLVGLVGEDHSIKATRNRLFEDPRFMRVGKTTWGLRAWGLEEYTGIADELKQRIEEGGGRAKLNELVETLVGLFDVKESSVRAYATAPMFVIEDGWLRLRKSHEPFPVSTDITGVRGCFAQDDGVSFLTQVTKDVLRGSGQTCPEGLAGHLGVRPGQPQEFKTRDGRLVVTWVESAALGPTFGSTRALAEEAGAALGDLLRLDFDLLNGRVTGHRVPALAASEQDPLDRAEELTGLNLTVGDPRALVARAVGAKPGDLAAALSRRKENDLLGLLPEPAKDPDLAAALADLSSVLEALDD